MDFNSTPLVRQQILETAFCPLLPESYRERNDAKYDVRSRWLVLRAVPACAQCWNRRVRYIIVRLYVLEQLGDELQRFSDEVCWRFEARPV